jgi:magnesium and cobalt transporter
MSEHPPPQPVPSHKHKTLLERLTAFIFREPENREELLEALHDAHERDLLDADALSMIEGVLQVSELRARDLMIPRSQMDVIDIAEPPDKWIPFVIETAHSRFPVIDGSRDHVIGILLAKDLLRYYTETDFDVRGSLRPAVFIPESKPLNVLLRDFRANRNHIALVVDEYGGVSGLITIEDVLEQIVGDIEDEYDFDESEDAIIQETDGKFRVKALTEIGQFNETFGTKFPDDEFDTIGGLVTDQFGRVPKRGEAVEIDDIRFEVLRADARHADLFLVNRIPKTVVREFLEDDEQRHPA